MCIMCASSCSTFLYSKDVTVNYISKVIPYCMYALLQCFLFILSLSIYGTFCPSSESRICNVIEDTFTLVNSDFTCQKGNIENDFTFRSHLSYT